MRRWTTALAALVASLVATADAGAVGPCETIARAAPAHTGTGMFRAPLFIGDSSMLLGVPALARLGFDADARGCRSGTAAVDLLAARSRAHRVRLAVLAVGANGGVDWATLKRARRLTDMLGLVAGAGNASAPKLMARVARKHPEDTVLIDWRATRPWRYGGDGIHIGTAGEAVEARFIHRQVRPYLPPSQALARAVPRQVPAAGCGDGVFVVRGTLPCARALAVARAPGRRWLRHDWRVAGRPPFRHVLERRRPRVVLAIR
jgi:hypothetical protein